MRARVLHQLLLSWMALPFRLLLSLLLLWIVACSCYARARPAPAVVVVDGVAVEVVVVIVVVVVDRCLFLFCARVYARAHTYFIGSASCADYDISNMRDRCASLI